MPLNYLAVSKVKRNQNHQGKMENWVVDQKYVKRFWSRVQKTDYCWNWIGSKCKNGYGRISIKDKYPLTHRFSYVFFNGSIPKKLDLDHLCRNRACVNPDHLEVVTRGENLLRGNAPAAINARKTHCIHGHKFNKSNTIFYKYLNGIHRRCKKCERLKYVI